MTIVIATNNPGKRDELQHLLGEGAAVLTLRDLGLQAVEETGATFEENALLKARAASSCGFPAIADDSGLEVECLNGEPGVYSARFAGPNATDEENNALLLKRLGDCVAPNCRARFVSVVALVTPDGMELTATGTVSGRIIRAPRGTGGFGYDPLFELDDPHAREFNGKTMAELIPEEKNTVSHRARAYQQLSPAIRSILRSTNEDLPPPANPIEAEGGTPA